MLEECKDEEYIWVKEKQILTKKEIHIPGLCLFGHAYFDKAQVPLEEHFHRGKKEFVVVIKGKQQYAIGKQIYDLYGGDVFITEPDELHGNLYEPQSKGEFIWFQLDMRTPKTFLGLQSPLREYLYQKTLKYNIRVKKIEEKQINLLQQSFKYFATEEKELQFIGYSKFLAFFSMLILNNKKNENDLSVDIQNIQTYIQEHVFDTISFEQLAKIGNLSISRMKTKFKESVGMTPREYINTIKIAKAKKMLCMPGITVTEIAYMLSFSSSNYFSYVFKQFTGVTPLEYRKKYY